MKIGFLIEDAFSVGGVQRVTSVLANGLSEENEVSLICTRCKTNEINRKIYNLREDIDIHIVDRLKNENLLIRCVRKILKEINKKTGIFNNVKSLNILTQIYFPKKFRKSIVEFININKYDVVIGVEGLQSILLGCIAENLNSKVLGWQHNSYEAYLKNKGKYYWNLDILFKNYLIKLDKYIVLTEEDRRLYRKNLNINCNVIYNPLSFESKMKSKCNNKSIIFVGRLVENQKGIDLLIQAFNLVHKKHKDWILKIVGNGPDKQKIIKQINKFNLEEAIIIAGENTCVEKFYLESSIFISSSRWEGFGLVITEAMECGVPVIAFKNSGPKEIIDKNNINGILVPCNDVNKLADKIIELIENKDKRLFISKNSIKRAKDFSINNIICKWNEVISEN